MGLRIYNFDQGSSEWHDARRGIMTASVVGQFITPKTIKPALNDKTRAMAYQLVAERITGYTEPSYASADMEDGHTEEPIARDIYTEHFAQANQIGFMVEEFNGHKLGYSPDGVVGADGLIEVKTRAPKKHLATIISDEVPPENMAQVQCGLLVSGREWCDFVSYCGGMKLWVKRVHRDARWQIAIGEALNAFEETAATMIGRYHSATFGMPDTERIEQYLDDEIRI